MLHAKVLGLWVFLIAPLQVYGQVQSSSVLTRLDTLEGLLSQLHAQHQKEYHQWLKKEHVLMERIQHLEQDVHSLRKENQEIRNQAGALVTENQDLRADLVHVQHQVDVMAKKQRSLDKAGTQGSRKATRGGVSDSELVEDDPQDLQTAEEASEQMVQILEDPHDTGHVENASSSPYMTESGPSRVKDVYHSHHRRSARSDDAGPLEVMMDHLSQKMTRLSADVQTLKTSHAQQQVDLHDARTSTFIHWGSSSCSASSELVYSGVLGGSWYNHTGAAANALCLSMSPKLKDFAPRFFSHTLYGGEYLTGDSENDRDPVCAVCRVSHSSTFMLPGTNVCPSDWTRQYSGFLMAGHTTDAGASQFICVDEKLESLPGSDDAQRGHVLYYVKTGCGSLPCGPYEENKVATCAVCSK